MQSGLVGVRGVIAPKLVATEPAFAPEHVLHKISHQFQPIFHVRGNLIKQVLVPSGNAQVRKLRFNFPHLSFNCYFTFINLLFILYSSINTSVLITIFASTVQGLNVLKLTIFLKERLTMDHVFTMLSKRDFKIRDATASRTR